MDAKRDPSHNAPPDTDPAGKEGKEARKATSPVAQGAADSSKAESEAEGRTATKVRTRTKQETAIDKLIDRLPDMCAGR